MYKHLLIAVDSAKSDKAICACQSARGEGDVVTATEPWTEAAYATPPTPHGRTLKVSRWHAATPLNAQIRNVGAICVRPTRSSKAGKKQNAIALGSHGRAASGGSFLAALPLKCSVSAKDPYSSATRLRGRP